jgi:cytochrome b subunit of formate dehydrogenase
MTRYIVRFSPWQRFQHWAVLVLFALLCVTGLSQRYPDVPGSAWVLGAMGGVDGARWIHRVGGLAFTALLVAHFAGVIGALLSGRGSLSMVPHRKDFTDAVQTLRYYMGLRDRPPRFDRYDYKQKFEYWGMALGSMVVVGTGLVLLYPVAVTKWLPGSVVPVALVAHGYEGVLAFLTIITWHIFNACFTPDVFPLDTSIFTGRISEERMRHEHPLELERIEAVDGGSPGPPHTAA